MDAADSTRKGLFYSRGSNRVFIKCTTIKQVFIPLGLSLGTVLVGITTSKFSRRHNKNKSKIFPTFDLGHPSSWGLLILTLMGVASTTIGFVEHQDQNQTD